MRAYRQLVEYIDWRFIFALNIPVGVLGLLLGATLLREMETRRDPQLDFRGFVFSAVGSSSLLYALSEAPSDGWGAVHILALLALGGLSLLAWLWTELSVENPLVELRIFRRGTYSPVTFINFIIVMGMFSTGVVQRRRGPVSME